MKAIETKGKIDDKGHLIIENIVSWRNKQVRVILLAPEQDEVGEIEEEQQEWLQWSSAGLERAYGEDEPEYTLDMIKEPNPGFRK